MGERTGHIGMAPAPTGVMMLYIAGVAILATMDVTIMGRSAWILAAFAPLIWAVPTAVRCIAFEGLSGRSAVILVSSIVPTILVGAAILGVNVGNWWPIVLIVIGIGQLGWRR